jgi:hypothetical protein
MLLQVVAWSLQALLAAFFVFHSVLFLFAPERLVAGMRDQGRWPPAIPPQGPHSVWGRCVELEGVPPYWPWVQVLRAVSALQPDGKTRLAEHALEPAAASGVPVDARLAADQEERAPTGDERVDRCPKLSQLAPAADE